MNISIFDLFSIGVGPSSSHTVGPMRASYRFLEKYQALLPQTHRFTIELYGSLALTGKGHCTDSAVILGAGGFIPSAIDIEASQSVYQSIADTHRIRLLGEHEVVFDIERDLIFHYKEALPQHSNGMRFTLYGENGNVLTVREYFSIGGGFILDQDEISQADDPALVDSNDVPFPFDTSAQLMAICSQHHLSVAEVMMRNEESIRPKQSVRDGVLEIWAVMNGSIDRGLTSSEAYLPGGLKVKRRAPDLYRKINAALMPMNDLNRLNAYAIAVNEENAAGGKVVTAPTNGAAGVIPAVLRYYLANMDEVDHIKKEDIIIDYLLTTAAIGILFKKGASISAAEVGCQGEVGVACSMAAGGLCALMGGSYAQVENAAEIGMEHNLGLTCDPIGGLVQIPCIERNAMGAVQAVNAAKIAMLGDGAHIVSLDAAIATMKQTGKDMSTKYKETSQGGLAVNLPAC